MSFSDGLWTKSGITCPNCKGTDTEINIMEVFLSMPEQYKYRCKCGHHWYSTEYHLIPAYEEVKPIINKPSGSYGWICPVCGAGVSPYQDHCPCCSGKNWTPTWTCGSGSISSDGSTPQYQLYNSNTESNVGVCASMNKTDAELLIDTANEIKNNIRKQNKNDRSK